MEAFDEDAEPFDLRDEGDEIEDDDLEDATEDDVDFVVAAYREEGKAVAVPLDFDLANDLDELISQLSRLPADAGAFGFVSIAGEFFVIVHTRGRTVEVLLSDATAANDWPIARDVMDFLGADIPDVDDDPAAAGDMDMLAAQGMSAFELEAVATDYDEDSAEAVFTIARKMKLEREFAAAAAFDR